MRQLGELRKKIDVHQVVFDRIFCHNLGTQKIRAGAGITLPINVRLRDADAVFEIEEQEKIICCFKSSGIC